MTNKNCIIILYLLCGLPKIDHVESTIGPFPTRTIMMTKERGVEMLVKAAQEAINGKTERPEKTELSLKLVEKHWNMIWIYIYTP